MSAPEATATADRAATGPILEARGVTMQFGGLRALGDVSLRQDKGTFARYGRELTGVTARGAGGDVEGVATLAGVKGVFVSRQFQGTEAVQGPYILSDDEGRTGVAIVAGSEVVWLDGVRMARGETADYAMDYDRGQLTFSARRLISSASRIAIDYQVALTEYRRNVSSFGGGWTRSKVRRSSSTRGCRRGRRSMRRSLPRPRRTRGCGTSRRCSTTP